jgi:site-specific DNA-methyltransferase (adenine-specific)
MNGTNPMADAELAWQNIKGTTRMFRWHHFSGEKTTKIHPTQKPAKLYKWILENYAKEGDKILDTHLGSGSIAIACHDYDFELTACELDKEYYDKAIKRIKNHTSQIKLF